MNTCLMCRTQSCRELLDLGNQPVSQHFFDGTQAEDTGPIVLGQCEHCGLVQLIGSIAAEKLTPRYDWLTYNEPEEHLAALVEVLQSLPGITTDACISGVSFKEDPALRYFQQGGFRRTWRIDMAGDLGITDTKAGPEMVQQHFQPPLVSRLHQKYGVPDVVIARLILEHTHDTANFLKTLRQLVKPTGYVAIEVPECARAFDTLDYTTLWEDHVLYFVESTLCRSLEMGGFSVVRLERYQYPYENCMVAIARPQPTADASSTGTDDIQFEKRQATTFAEGFRGRQQALRQLLTQWRRRGKVALFGAGHGAAMFVNLLGLGDLINFVIDDHPHKRGLRMPGSRLPIVGSEVLETGEVALCLSSLGANSEKKVLRKHQAFVAHGGAFASIIPASKEEPLTWLAHPTGATTT